VTRNSRNREVIAREAAEWLIANRGDLNSQQRKKFEEWRNAAPEHEMEYEGVAEVSRDLPLLIDDPLFNLDSLLERVRAEDEDEEDEDEDEDEEEDGEPPGRPVVRRVAWALAATATLAVTVIIGLQFFRPQPIGVLPSTPLAAATQFSTVHGEQKRQRLADGSVMHLNTDTTVLVTYSKDLRQVRLSRGQAVFEVVHDASRPFRVSAGSVEITDVGTKFDVYIQDDSTRVTVMEGRVSVVSGSSGTRPLLLAAGDQVRVTRGQLPAVASPVDAGQATAWMRRQIAFQHQPLGEVVAEFNRYTSKPMEIETPGLRTLQISGVFAQDDVDSFIAFLRSLDGVQVEVREDRIRVSRR